MATYIVTFKGKRTVTQSFVATACVDADDFSGVQAAVSKAAKAGDYTVEEVLEDDLDADSSPASLARITLVEEQDVDLSDETGDLDKSEDELDEDEEESEDEPTGDSEYRPARSGMPTASGYTPSRAMPTALPEGVTGAEGVAVARVESPNGYTPARVRHVPA